MALRRHPPRDLREAPRVPEGLHVQRDDRRALVVGPVLEQVVGRHVGPVAQRGERRDAQAARGCVAEQRQAERTRLRGQRQPAGGHADAADEGVQAHARLGVDHAQRVGPEQPQAVGADGVEHGLLALAALGLVAVREARRDHEQRAHAAARRLVDDAQHLGGRHRHDRELRRLGQVAQRARRAGRRHHAAAGVHRDRDAGEAAAHDVAIDGAADAVPAVRGADDGDRGGGEQRAQRGHGGDVRAVGPALLVALGRAQVEREVDLAVVGLAPGVEARAREDPEHRAVSGHHGGVEAGDRARRRDLGELLEQSRGQAAAVHLVGHREGDLGGRRLVEAVVAGDGDNPPVEVRQQCHPGVAVGVGVVARHDVGASEAVEAQVAALGRERVEERLDVGLVLGAG
jgi:hypothetical protein